MTVDEMTEDKRTVKSSVQFTMYSVQLKAKGEMTVDKMTSVQLKQVYSVQLRAKGEMTVDKMTSVQLKTKISV